jgi:hypothetical protein
MVQRITIVAQANKHVIYLAVEQVPGVYMFYRDTRIPGPSSLPKSSAKMPLTLFLAVSSSGACNSD